MTDWDVEQYRHPWDSDDQWEVRRQFMLQHKHEIPEDKLVCLAQVYANMEFLHCSYPDEVMEQVRALAADLDESNLERRRKNQNVAFVKESGEQKTSNIKGPPAKQTRWGLPSEGNTPANRPSASSFFDRSADGRSFEGFSQRPNDTTTESTNKYSMQSYYTSTYKTSNQSSAPECNLDGRRGPGADHGRSVDTAAFSHSNFANPCPNLGAGMTTTSSGKNTSDDVITILQQRFDFLVQFLSDPQVANNFTRELLNKGALKAHLPLTCLPKSMELGPNQNFKSQLYLDNVLVVTTEGFLSEDEANFNACELAVKKLRSSKIKIVKNATGQLELNLLNRDPGLPGPRENLQSLNNDGGPIPQDSLIRLKTRFENFILIEYAENASAEDSRVILQNSANLNGCHVSYTFENLSKRTTVQIFRCVVRIRQLVVSEGSGTTRKIAKTAAALAAVNLLRTLAYTIVVKKNVMSDGRLSKEELSLPPSLVSDESNDTEEKSELNVEKLEGGDAISEDNMGHKLLRLMGWSGGGLGKPGQEGISEPIRAQRVCRKAGMGLNSNQKGITREFTAKITAAIREFARVVSHQDLVFTPEFSKEERAHIHKIARKFRLKSTSRCKGANRHLVLSHPMNKLAMAMDLIRSGGANEKYMIKPPVDGSGNFKLPKTNCSMNHIRFPDHD